MAIRATLPPLSIPLSASGDMRERERERDGERERERERAKEREREGEMREMQLLAINASTGHP